MLDKIKELASKLGFSKKETRLLMVLTIIALTAFPETRSYLVLILQLI